MMSTYVLATIALSISKQWCGWEYQVEGRHTAFQEDISVSTAMNCIERRERSAGLGPAKTIRSSYFGRRGNG